MKCTEREGSATRKLWQQRRSQLAFQSKEIAKASFIDELFGLCLQDTCEVSVSSQRFVSWALELSPRGCGTLAGPQRLGRSSSGWQFMSDPLAVVSFTVHVEDQCDQCIPQDKSNLPSTPVTSRLSVV